MEQYSVSSSNESSRSPTQISYDQLDEKNKKIILKHLKIAAEIGRWRDIEEFLSSEFLDKKSLKEEKLSISDSLSDQYYRKYVSRSKYKCSAFPFVFRDKLTYCMTLELESHGNKEEIYSKGFDVHAVYWDQCSTKPENLRCNAFDNKEWQLVRCAHMTQKDIQVMEQYKRGLITFLESCVNIMNKYDDGYNICEDELIEIKKYMIVV